MPIAARSWKPRNVDLVVSLSHCVAKSVRVPEGIPHVCYCFTPMRYAWQGRDAYLDSWHTKPVRRTAVRLLLDVMRRWDWATASPSRVSHFIAISETVRQRISRCYGRESRVIPPPVDTAYYHPDDGPRDDVYLCVSALVPYKRVEQAVAACSMLGRRLDVIGAGPERARLERLAGDCVRFLGWQPDEVIREHYRRCRALLFPGEEDFGIVPVEALACGAPVIALGRGGATETVDQTVGQIYMDPTTEGLLEAIQSFESRGTSFDPQRARRKAEGFALPLFQERLLSFLADVVEGRVRDRVPPAPHLPR
jgi:glycosyltransferase involved in cell wall biosynthesis